MPVISWDRLRVEEVQPENTTITYDILAANAIGTACTSTVLKAGLVSNEFDSISISDVNPSNQYICLRVNLSRDTTTDPTPIVKGFMVTYIGNDPFFTFDVVTQADALYNTPEHINNIADISTSTPEITYDNNRARDTVYLRQADIEVTKTVDRTALSASEVAAGASLVYTVTLENHGPQPANVHLEDIFGDHLLSSGMTIDVVSTLPQLSR